MRNTSFITLGVCLLLTACAPKKVDEAVVETDEMAVVDETPADVVDTGDANTEASTDATAAENGAASSASAALSATPANTNTYVDTKGRTVYTFAEVAPSFVGGEKEMNTYLRKTLKYPDTEAEGTVFVSFVVDEKGGVGETKVERGAEDQKLRDEAVRVVSGMPRWTAGKQGGKAVPVKFTLPVTFKRTV